MDETERAREALIATMRRLNDGLAEMAKACDRLSDLIEAVAACPEVLDAEPDED